jgi:hypothetical protein
MPGLGELLVILAIVAPCVVGLVVLLRRGRRPL